jgi:hypothetical protein
LVIQLLYSNRRRGALSPALQTGDGAALLGKGAYMKSLFCVALILATSACYAADSSVQVWNGKPRATRTLTLHVDGQPMSVTRIEIMEHSMGCMLETGNCFVRNTLVFWIQAGAQAQNCQKWFSTVHRQETTIPEATPYPYLQLVTGSEQVLTDEGISVYPVGAVTCNGSLDWVDLQ